MKIKILAAAFAAAALCCVPALSGCFSETYVEYTLYSSDGEVIRTDNLSENPNIEIENQPSADELEPAPAGSYYMVTDYSGSPKNVVIPAEVNGTEVRGIGEQAFGGCRRIVTLEVEEGVSEVGQAAFIYCVALQSVELPSTMNVGESMFGGCASLASVTLAEGITSIGNQAFYQCNALKEINADASSPINLPSTLEFIGGHAFYDCNALEGTVTIPSGITKINQYAFSLCSSLTSVEILGEVTYIGFGAFGGCHSLESINIPSTVTEIGDYAFSNTYELKEVALSADLEYLGQYAFQASGITSVTMPAGKMCYLYYSQLAADDPETEKDEAVLPGSDDAERYLVEFYYSEDVRNDPDAKGRIPSYELSNGEKVAEWLLGDLVDAYWYFVSIN